MTQNSGCNRLINSTRYYNVLFFILVGKGMNYALVKLFPFHRIFISKTKLRKSILPVHPNQYFKVVNSLMGNHHRSSTVILTQNWLKEINKKYQYNNWKIKYNFFYLSEQILSWPPWSSLQILIHEFWLPVGKWICETNQPLYQNYILIKIHLKAVWNYS